MFDKIALGVGGIALLAVIVAQVRSDWRYARVNVIHLWVTLVLIIAMRLDLDGPHAELLFPYYLLLAWLLGWGCFNLFHHRKFTDDPPGRILPHGDTIWLANILAWFGWFDGLMLIAGAGLTTMAYWFFYQRKPHRRLFGIVAFPLTSWSPANGVPLIAVMGSFSLLFAWLPFLDELT